MKVVSTGAQTLPNREHEKPRGASAELQPPAPDQFRTSDTAGAHEALSACFLLAIISGFAAFVAFGQAILPAIVAAVIGAFIGLMFANEHPKSSRSSTTQGMVKSHRHVANR